MSQGLSRLRFQVSIATLLWLTLCVASFFGGRYWERTAKLRATAAKIALRVAPARATSTPVAISRTYIQLTPGASTTVNTSVPINRLLVADPEIARIVPISDRSFQLTARETGATKITVSGLSDDETATYDLVVQ
jgi:Flp pilus assembly secretin CpaC